MAEQLHSERRGPMKQQRKERIAVGVGIGTPLAAVFAWYLSLKGVVMPPGVEAAIGAILGVGVVCLHDVAGNFIHILGQIVRKWLKL